MADIKSLSMTLADAIDSIRDNITVAGMAEMIEHTINAALRRTLDTERSELQARLDAEAWADTEIRRTYGAEFGLHEEGDSPPCWEDFANHIRALRTALTPTTDGERGAWEALADFDRSNAVPPCRLCGKALTLQSADAFCRTWACEGGDWRKGHWSAFDDTPERTMADQHYSRSQFEQRSSGMAEHLRTALTLLATERAKATDAARERDELRAALLNESGQGDPPSPRWFWTVNAWNGRGNTGGLIVRNNPVWNAETLRWSPNSWTLSIKDREDTTHPTAREAMIAADAIERGTHTKVTP